MLKIYRRHYDHCKNRTRNSRKCNCPVWVQGSLKAGNEKVPIRKSMNTKDWEAAARMVLRMESGGENEREPVTFFQAKERFIVETERRELHWSTEKKYKLVMRQMDDFLADSKILMLSDINLETLRAFVGTLKDGPLAKAKKIDRLRSFFKFCINSDWLERNPAKLLTPPIAKRVPTLPFNDVEVGAITSAAAGKTKVFVLLLLNSGLRISDASMLKASSLTGEKLFLRQEKTGEPVYVPLPPFLVQELKVLPLFYGYFFVSGSIRKETVANNWRRKLDKVFESAGVEGAHPHRFRDTFAVNLLRKDASLETVSKLLGHTSIKVTERHYTPFVKSLQKKLEEDVRKTW
jgi:integrase/recombinase XerD